MLELARQQPDAEGTARQGELPGEQADPEVTVDDFDVREQVSSADGELVSVAVADPARSGRRS